MLSDFELLLLLLYLWGIEFLIQKVWDKNRNYLLMSKASMK